MGIRKKSRRVLTLILSLGVFSSSISWAGSERFEFQELQSFPTLEQSGSLEKFEAKLANYQTKCLNWYGASSATSHCLMGYSLWDRELNIQYKALRKRLSPEQREQLKAAQKQWLSARDALLEFNSELLDQRYREFTSGTMFIGMRALDWNETVVPMIRSRALYFYNWVALLKQPVEG